MVSYGDRPNDYDSISNCVFIWLEFGPVLILFQILGINLVPSINRTPQTGSENYTVRLSYACLPATYQSCSKSPLDFGHRYAANPHNNFQR